MDPRYKIGIPEMDEQHARLFELLNEASEVANDEFEMNSVVLKLLGYATFHLDAEEAMFVSEGLHEFSEEHVKMHDHFRHQAMEFYDRFREAPKTDDKREILREISRFCEEWLIRHIAVEDRKYAELLLKS